MNTGPASPRTGSAGCLGYGCLVAVVLLLLVLGGVGFYLLSSFRNAVDKYTAEAPTMQEAPPPGAEIGQSAFEKLREMSVLFSQGGSQDSVSFNSAELTALAQSIVGPRTSVELAAGTFKVTTSLELSKLFAQTPWTRALLGAREDRYVNGTATGKIKLITDQDERIRVDLESLSFNEQPLEGDALVRASQWFSGWASSAAKDLENSGGRVRLNRLELSEDALTLGVSR